METRISSKGQITLPVEVRKKLGIKTGDILRVSVDEEGAIIISAEKKNENKCNPLEVLSQTAGAWKDMEESGEEFVHRLRNEDAKRLKVLGIE
ncbi:regulators of stationary/sporulation gene expression [Desulfocucumis palustris]|uniref:Regulators of stationary/sporulation gene expression n=1 Tax=Desulfocucumis palustris TaxID=1898651 RepID=A0A2L2XHG7_9FIRM|nr:AbrB/MazE/SpoVT family DNA-binding domain-containing protein [Desulfocucumis palustris]GBF35655.1 regulators of stationary/sporulation gene expression [Desulfocucumis palustris]